MAPSSTTPPRTGCSASPTSARPGCCAATTRTARRSRSCSTRTGTTACQRSSRRSSSMPPRRPRRRCTGRPWSAIPATSTPCAMSRGCRPTSPPTRCCRRSSRPGTRSSSVSPVTSSSRRWSITSAPTASGWWASTWRATRPRSPPTGTSTASPPPTPPPSCSGARRLPPGPDSRWPHRRGRPAVVRGCYEPHLYDRSSQHLGGQAVRLGDPDPDLRGELRGLHALRPGGPHHLGLRHQLHALRHPVHDERGLCPCPQRPRASRRGLPLLPGACPGRARARALPGVLLPGHPGPALLRLGLLRHLLPPERTQLLHSRGATDLALQVRDPRLCGTARPAGARRGGPLPGLPEARQLATPPG